MTAAAHDADADDDDAPLSPLLRGLIEAGSGTASPLTVCSQCALYTTAAATAPRVAAAVWGLTRRALTVCA